MQSISWVQSCSFTETLPQLLFHVILEEWEVEDLWFPGSQSIRLALAFPRAFKDWLTVSYTLTLQ